MNIIAEDAAYLVDPHNTINIRESVLQVIEDERLRIEKVAKGLEIAKKYSVGAIRKQYVQIWRNLDSSFE